MKLSFITISFIFTSLFSPNPVIADHMIRFVFNNGNDLPSGQICNDADNDKIDHVFNLGRRNLRGTVETSSISKTTRARQLVFYPSYCRKNCAGFKRGFCKATNCKGLRRHLQNEKEPIVDRELLTCDEEINTIHKNLDSLVATNALSPGCNAVLNASRNVTCYDDIIYGEVDNFIFWKSTSHGDSILQMNAQNGYSVCQNISFNIEAVVNSCVDNVKFHLTGSHGFNNYTQNESVIPYTLFGDYNNNIFGRTLPVGSYILAVTPDGVSTKRKTLSFTVESC
jgi:hypothetical protein